jgi:hypothetical protein
MSLRNLGISSTSLAAAGTFLSVLQTHGIPEALHTA